MISFQRFDGSSNWAEIGWTLLMRQVKREHMKCIDWSNNNNRSIYDIKLKQFFHEIVRWLGWVRWRAFHIKTDSDSFKNFFHVQAAERSKLLLQRIFSPGHCFVVCCFVCVLLHWALRTWFPSMWIPWRARQFQVCSAHLSNRKHKNLVNFDFLGV